MIRSSSSHIRSNPDDVVVVSAAAAVVWAAVDDSMAGSVRTLDSFRSRVRWGEGRRAGRSSRSLGNATEMTSLDGAAVAAAAAVVTQFSDERHLH